MIKLKIPPGKRKFSLDREDRLISCHRCGNIRKSQYRCSVCPQTFCAQCYDKLKIELGEDCFQGGKGCPLCMHLCCCAVKSVDCKHENHCYRKCPVSRIKWSSSTPTTAAAASPTSEFGKENNTFENSAANSPHIDYIDGSDSANEQPAKRPRLESSSVADTDGRHFTRSRKPKQSKSEQSSPNSKGSNVEISSITSSRKSVGKAISKSSLSTSTSSIASTSLFYSLHPTPLLQANIDAKMLLKTKLVGSASTLPPSGPSPDRLSSSDNEQQQSSTAEFAVPQAPCRLITKPVDVKQLLDMHTLTRLEPGENPFFMSSLPFPQLNNCKPFPTVKHLLSALREGELPSELNGPLLQLQGEEVQYVPTPSLPSPLLPFRQAPHSISNMFARNSQQQQAATTSTMPRSKSVGGSDTSEEGQQQTLDRFMTSPKNDHQLQMLIRGAMYSPFPAGVVLGDAQLQQQQLIQQQALTPAVQANQEPIQPIPTPGQLRATRVFNSPDFNWIQRQSPFVQPIPPNFFHFT